MDKRLGMNIGAVRATVFKNDGLKTVGEKGAQVCNLTVTMPHPNDKDGDGNAATMFVDVAAWGEAASAAAAFAKGARVDVCGAVETEEWANSKLSTGDNEVQDNRLKLDVSDRNDDHFVRAAEDDGPHNTVQMAGEIAHLFDAEKKTWKKDGEEKSAFVRGGIVKIPKELADGRIVTPTVRVRFFGNKCEDLEKGAWIELEGVLENSTFKQKRDGAEDDDVNRYRGAVFVGAGGEVKVGDSREEAA